MDQEIGIFRPPGEAVLYPRIKVFTVRHNMAAAPRKRTMDGQPRVFPTLCGADTAAQVLGNLFPSAQNHNLNSKPARQLLSVRQWGNAIICSASGSQHVTVRSMASLRKFKSPGVESLSARLLEPGSSDS